MLKGITRLIVLTDKSTGLIFLKLDLMRFIERSAVVGSRDMFLDLVSMSECTLLYSMRFSCLNAATDLRMKEQSDGEAPVHSRKRREMAMARNALPQYL